MAANDIRVPRLSELDAGKVSVEYDERSDSLYIYLTGIGTPAISVALDKHVLLRVDPDSNELVGIEIEAFLNSAVIERPGLLAFAEMARISEPVMDRWRTDDRSRRAELRAIQQFLDSSLETSEP